MTDTSPRSTLFASAVSAGLFALVVCSPHAAAFVVSNFNSSGFDYTWGGFGQTVGPTSVRLVDADNGWGGATIDYASPIDMSALTAQYLEVDYFTNPLHASDSFSLEFYDTADRSIKFAVPTAGSGAPQTTTLPNAFGTPADGVGDYANFDYGNVRSFTVIGQWQGTQPFDLDIDEVRFTADAPPPYAGHAPDAAWRAEADARIDQHRKADLSLNLSRPGGAPLSGALVRVRQQEHAFKFGSAAQGWRLAGTGAQHETYQQKVEELFNLITLEASLNWKAWEGEWGPNFTPDRALAGLDWAEQNGIDARGHNLVWPGWRWLPDDLRDLDSDPAALAQAVLDHIAVKGAATQGKVVDWDVVNEPLGNRDLMDILGDTVVDDWFAAAAAINDARLFLNETNIVTSGFDKATRRAAFLAELQGLQQRGAPLDAIGIQGHFRRDTLTGIEEVWDVLDQFHNATGLPITITEFDFETDDEQLQAEYLRDFMTAVFAHEGVDAFVQWGFWEGAHWRPDAALYRADWSIKPNGQAYLNLVFDQWWTDETVTLDADGEARLRVFQGEHLVEVEVDGVVETYRLSVGPNGYTLSEALTQAAAAGDFNFNGQVEQGDLDLVLQNWGRDVHATGVPAGWVADVPSGSIDQNELDRVLQNWGVVNAPLSTPLPEPAALVVVLAVGCWGRGTRRDTRGRAGLCDHQSK